MDNLDETASVISASKVTGTNVYSTDGDHLGEIYDIMLEKRSGNIAYAVMSFGGFLGMGEKDIAVPFSAIHATEKNSKWYLTMNATKDSLKAAHGYKYDRAKATWVPA